MIESRYAAKLPEGVWGRYNMASRTGWVRCLLVRRLEDRFGRIRYIIRPYLRNKPMRQRMVGRYSVMVGDRYAS